MCGIFGYMSNKEQGDLLLRMGSVITHRGPDGVGYYSKDRLHMGARRLSIIDLDKGDQPISNESGTVWTVFNGEIYNYIEVAEELKERGHVFNTRCDTEVIVHAYEEYGYSFLDRLNGMFAFALYDENTKKLIIARDRFGEKPLYYYKDQNIFIFASEIKSLLELLNLERRLNRDVLFQYFILRYVPAPNTLFKDIYKLPAAHYIEVDDRGFSIKEYWRVKFGELDFKRQEDYFEHFEMLFTRAVKTRMRTDVPLGLYLSSGVDSTSIAAVMRENSMDRISTYSIGCMSTKDELAGARESASILNSFHHELYYNEESLGLLDQIIWHLEEPIGDAHIIPTFHLAKGASRSLKVVLLGEGADEPLFGYPFHKIFLLETIIRRITFGVPLDTVASLLLKMVPVAIMNLFFPLPTTLGLEGKRKLVEYAGRMGKYSVVEKYVHLTSLFTFEELSRLFLYRTKDDVFGYESKNDEICGNKDMILKQTFQLQMKGWLQDNILLRHDKLSMAHSIEARSPFLDHELVEFLVNVPVETKFRNGRDKYILRRFLSGRLNRKIAKRKKIPFFAPIEKFVKTREFNRLIEDNLSESNIREGNIFDYKELMILKNRAVSNNFLAVKKLMSIIIFEIWRKRFKVSS